VQDSSNLKPAIPTDTRQSIQDNSNSQQVCLSHQMYYYLALHILSFHLLYSFCSQYHIYFMAYRFDRKGVGSVKSVQFYYEFDPWFLSVIRYSQLYYSLRYDFHLVLLIMKWQPVKLEVQPFA